MENEQKTNDIIKIPSPEEFLQYLKKNYTGEKNRFDFCPFTIVAPKKDILFRYFHENNLLFERYIKWIRDNKRYRCNVSEYNSDGAQNYDPDDLEWYIVIEFRQHISYEKVDISNGIDICFNCDCPIVDW
tara:strand:- start:443 stop:832 length:390 start_codon:yes stop_codon:yes gene_type:complete